jgi:hypothetical protein
MACCCSASARRSFSRSCMATGRCSPVGDDRVRRGRRRPTGLRIRTDGLRLKPSLPTVQELGAESGPSHYFRHEPDAQGHLGSEREADTHKRTVGRQLGGPEEPARAEIARCAERTEADDQVEPIGRRPGRRRRRSPAPDAAADAEALRECSYLACAAERNRKPA